MDKDISVPGQIRIIAGKWRGRKLKVPEHTDLRPTPDRVRETVFNWLQFNIVDSHCLDMFAGSGALGFEALSRGAQFVDFIDNSPTVIRHLNDTLKQLNANNASFHRGDALTILPTIKNSIDIVFLDPPFQKDLLLPCCSFLEQSNLLSFHNRIYIETNKPLSELKLSHRWQCMHEKKAGNVFYALFHLVVDNDSHLR